MTMDKGTLGKNKSHIVLNNLLVKENNKIITRQVMRIWSWCADVVPRMQKTMASDPSLLMMLLMIFKEKQLQRIEKIRPKVPALIYTYLRCCVVGLFRDTLREINKAVPQRDREHSKTGKAYRNCWPILFEKEEINHEEV